MQTSFTVLGNYQLEQSLQVSRSTKFIYDLPWKHLNGKTDVDAQETWKLA